MNPIPLFVLAISLPLLLGGCGEKKEPVANTKPELEGVNAEELEYRKDIWYLKGSDTPYTGKTIGYYPNGTIMNEGGWKEGKPHGTHVVYESPLNRRKVSE